MMEWTPVSSSHVAAVGYDDSTNTLGVRFLTGAEYHYPGVPRSIYEGLLSAPSVGSFLDAYVKKAGYPAVRVS